MTHVCDLINVKIGFGNNVSHSKRKTRRRFEINLRSIRVHSKILKRTLSLRLSARTIRTVDQYGGIDDFLKSFNKRLMTEKALKLKSAIASMEKNISDDAAGSSIAQSAN